MQISDIQKVKLDPIGQGAEITLADDEGYDVMTLKLSKDDIWQIVDFAHHSLSYGAQLKEERKLGIKR